MKSIDEFCGQKNGYSRSITIRNRLIPVGKTEEKLRELRLLENDKKRADNYQKVKELMDDYHRSFIEDVISETKLDWKDLYDKFDLYQSEKDKDQKNKLKTSLKKTQEIKRREISKRFSEDERYIKLFKEELLSNLIPEIIKNYTGQDKSDKEASLNAFNKFSTYFTGFHDNRRNMYSAEEKSTAISYRIVNENFPKFYANIKLYEYLEENFPSVIDETEDSLKVYLNGKKLKEIFTIEAFNEVLSQKGIDFYNTIISGISDTPGNKKIQGLNEKINLKRQQLSNTDKNKLRGKMSILYKQILSDRETASFIPIDFADNEEVYKSIQYFKENSLNKALKEIKLTFYSSNDYNLGQVFVPAKELANFSNTIFGHWSILREGLFAIEESKSKKALSESQIDKINSEIAKKDYSLEELQTAYEKYCTIKEKTVDISVKEYFTLAEYKDAVTLSDNLNRLYDNIDFDSKRNLQYEKDAATEVKEFLDELQNLYHYIKLVDYRGEEETDSAFYSRLQEILDTLSEVIPLYNRVRNFVTKKHGSIKKFKLNFDCPTLANGWDKNKEKNNNAIILRKDGKYYLGIFNPKDKPKFDIEENSCQNCYEKMVYKLLPGPNKMLPKVFFSAKNKDIFTPPQDIIDGYKEGLHKKGESFDRDFMYRLIDWFKDCLNLYEDWKYFEFKFSPTNTYEDISSFYKEVEAQGYKIKFQKVSSMNIDDMVNSGKLFLFQIYNKDFAENSIGKKNLHTLYWQNLFSLDNLNDICLKLNGEAELFFRPADKNLKVITHRKDSILVNKTTSDGKSIPEELYQEIYQFKNNMSSSISQEAGKLLESGTVICKRASHEITKDKHFTQDTYLFHCPVTMNFKAPEITGKRFNERVISCLKNNPGIKIIGLDRGERNLIYLSLINQKGEIELQKTLNLVEQNRNDKTVFIDYHEKLVQKAGDRDAARKNWQTIDSVKELKEGYLSNVVQMIARLMVDNNAIVVMEDLNSGFKRSRTAVEQQVYQKFEQMLIDKLNYLVFKDRGAREKGGVLNAYQLTDKFTSFKELGKQCGWLFYVSPSYTSKIDPKTGFVDLFNTAGLTNVQKKKDFFDKFTGITYDAKEDCFVFSIDYSKFGNNADFKKHWNIYTRGERLIYSKQDNKTIVVNLTENLKKIFLDFNINYENTDNFIDSVKSVKAEKSNAAFYDELLRSFKRSLQMRNSIPNSDVDYILSPVKAEDGSFFDSREKEKLDDKAKLPVDADANGAYHIALKGLYLLKNNFNKNDSGYIENITNAQWLKFVQTKYGTIS